MDSQWGSQPGEEQGPGLPHCEAGAALPGWGCSPLLRGSSPELFAFIAPGQGVLRTPYLWGWVFTHLNSRGSWG